jgi:hypothetical protein
MRLHVKTYAPPHLKAGEHVARCGRAHPRTELIAICDLRDVRVGAPGVREACFCSAHSLRQPCLSPRSACGVRKSRFASLESACLQEKSGLAYAIGWCATIALSVVGREAGWLAVEQLGSDRRVGARWGRRSFCRAPCRLGGAGRDVSGATRALAGLRDPLRYARWSPRAIGLGSGGKLLGDGGGRAL